MSKWHGGKGSSPRKVDSNKFSENWDKIFGSNQWPDNPLEGGVQHAAKKTKKSS